MTDFNSSQSKISPLKFKMKDDGDYELYTVIARKKIQVNECKVDFSRNAGIISNWLLFPWACFLCGHRSFDYKVLHKHLTEVHGLRNSEDFLYKCTDCGNCINDYAQFLNHIRTEHHDALKRCCDVCGERFYGCEYLSLHRQDHAKFEKVYPQVYHCLLCIEVFSTVLEATEHRQVTHNINSVPNFQCQYCQKTFTRQFKKIAHEYLHTGERPFVCPRCSRGFISRDTLRRHMLQQKDTTVHKCDFCPLDFRYSCQLKKHKEEHEYKCDCCSAKFDKRILWMKHLESAEHQQKLCKKSQ